MSKERELLKKILNTGWLNHELSCEVEAILAQPEQEPVAWMYEWDSTTTGQLTCKYVNMGKDKPNVEANFLARNFIPLYTAPPKREPLSDEEIADLWGDKYAGKTFMVRNFARAIEKAHGIGGGE